MADDRRQDTLRLVFGLGLMLLLGYGMTIVGLKMFGGGPEATAKLLTEVAAGAERYECRDGEQGWDYICTEFRTGPEYRNAPKSVPREVRVGIDNNSKVYLPNEGPVPPRDTFYAQQRAREEKARTAGKSRSSTPRPTVTTTPNVGRSTTKHPEPEATDAVAAPAPETVEPIDPSIRDEPVANDVPTLTEQPKSASTKAPGKIKSETIAGYVEWMHGDYFIADGQRVRWDARTRTKLGRIPSVNATPLGYEVKVKGFRDTEGAVVAKEIEAKPNGAAAFEADVIAAFNTTENLWLRQGQMFEPQPDGRRMTVGRVVDSGERVQRVRRIMRRLVPAYVDSNALRVRVVENGNWNAFAMDNGAIWVFSGLIDATTDDELAIVLGHELAHYTHEHSRRGAKRNILGQLFATVADGALTSINSETARQTAELAAALSLSAWTTGYSRDLEDQADRVGLRYVHEAGYNVSVGPSLWARFRAKYGERDKVSSFFFETHSRPSDRMRNLERELTWNYANQAQANVAPGVDRQRCDRPPVIGTMTWNAMSKDQRWAECEAARKEQR